MIYDASVFDAFCADFDNEGLVGALTPTSITHDAIAGNLGELELVHPIDAAGKWMALQRGNIIKAWTRVRTVADIEDGEIVTTVEKWTVKETSTKLERAVYNKKSEGKKLGSVKKGQKVLVVQKPSNISRVKIKAENLTGWIEAVALEYETVEVLPQDPTAIEDIYPAWGMKQQLFRIYDEERTLTSVTVRARPIFGDLLGNMTIYKNVGAVSLQHAATRMLERCVEPHDFTALTNMADERTGVNWRHKNPIFAFFDPDEGMTAKWNCQAVIDNYEITLMKQAGKNRGMAVEYGRNLTGVTCNIVDEEVVTRVMPTGVKEDGKVLYLTDDTDELNPGNWIDADNRGDYPNPHVFHLECEDCTVSEELGKEKARQRMREQTQELLDSGVTMPTVNIKVTFAELGNTQQYAAWKELMHLDLYDKVTVSVPKIGFHGLLDVVRVKTDCRTGRAIEVEVGALGDVEVSISSYQIGGISGGKIFAGTIMAPQMGTNVIHAEHISANSIYTGALQAESVTAEKIQAGAIEAKLIEAETIIATLLKAGKIEAGMIDAGSITADKIAADAVTADKIAAGAVDAEKIAARSITAELLQAGIITADSGLIAVGAIQTAQIADGSITAAKIVSLNADVINAGTLRTDRLLLVGEGGVVYEINAASSGLSQTELSKEQYRNQLNGTVIVANSITAAQIAAGTITANEIAANAVTAAKINVADLFASEATIQAINAMDISGNHYLQLMVAGGVNLLRDSAKGASGTGYPLARYDLGEEIEDGETMTFTIWDAVLGSGKTHWSLYDSSGMYKQATLEQVGEGIYSATFQYAAGGNATQLALYPFPSSVTATSSVGKVKLERGSRTTEWTPSPLDPASAVVSGSTVFIDEGKVEISTPEFSVNTPGAYFNIPGSEDGSPIVEIGEDGLTAGSINAREGVWAPNIRELITDDHAYTVGTGGDYPTLQAVFDTINDKALDGDIVISLLDSVDAGGTLRGVVGSGKVIITPVNLLNIKNFASIVEKNAATPHYGMDSAGGEYIYVQADSTGLYRRVAMEIGHIGALGLRGKKLSFRCSMNSGSATNPATPEVRFYCGQSLSNSTHITSLVRGTPEGTTPTNYVFLTTTFTVPETAADDDILWMRFQAGAENTVNAGASAFFRYPVLVVGDTVGTNTPRNPFTTVSEIRIENCSARTYLHHLIFQNDTTNRGLSAFDANVSVNRCTFNGTAGFRLWGGSGAMYNCYGACTKAADARGGGAMEIFGTAPSGTKTGMVDTSNMLAEAPEGETPTDTTKTVEIVAKATGTYSGSAWWTSDAAARQGYTAANGTLRGAMIFDLSSVNGTITKMTLRLKRAEGYGKGGNVDVKIYGTNITSLSGAPTRQGTAVTGTIGPGKVKTFDVTSLKAYKAFVLQADDSAVMDGKTYSTNFARFAGTGNEANAPRLTVTYQ